MTTRPPRGPRLKQEEIRGWVSASWFDVWWRQPASLARAGPLSLGAQAFAPSPRVWAPGWGAPGSLWLGWPIVDDSYLFSSDYVGPAEYLSKMLSSREGEKNK